jgi:hypothetical protein
MIFLHEIHTYFFFLWDWDKLQLRFFKRKIIILRQDAFSLLNTTRRIYLAERDTPSPVGSLLLLRYIFFWHPSSLVLFFSTTSSVQHLQSTSSVQHLLQSTSSVQHLLLAQVHTPKCIPPSAYFQLHMLPFL